MNDLLRQELHDEGIKYAEMIQNLTNKAERRISALNKNSRGKSSKSFIKQNSKKISVKRGWSNQADLDWDEDKKQVKAITHEWHQLAKMLIQLFSNVEIFKAKL